MKIGDLRRSLFLDYDCKWNGVVRDITAKHERDEEVFVAAVHGELLSIIRADALLDHSFPQEDGSRVGQLFVESV